MATTQSTYHRNSAGNDAYEQTDSRLPEDYQSILACIHDATDFDEIAMQLSGYSHTQILRCLDELEAIGLIESIPLEWLAELDALADYEPQPLAQRR